MSEQMLETIRRELHEGVVTILQALDPEYDTRPFLERFDTASPEVNFRTAWCMARSAALVYRNQQRIGWEVERCYPCEAQPVFDFVEDHDTDTQLFLIADDDKVVVAFRGTQTDQVGAQIRDLITDADARQVDFHQGTKVHKGFLTAFRSVEASVKRFIDTNDPDNRKGLWITGHSLGGALAALCFAEFHLGDDEGFRRRAARAFLYTYGQPRVGDEAFLAKMAATEERVCRCVNNNDPITFIPRGHGYGHFGRRLYIDTRGQPKWLGRNESVFFDRIKGMVEFVVKSALAMGAGKVLKKSVAGPSVIADHDKFGYIRGVGTGRDRELREAKAKELNVGQ